MAKRKVERSHREDDKIVYDREIFYSIKELKDRIAKHEKRYNTTAKQVLNFMSPQEKAEEGIELCPVS